MIKAEYRFGVTPAPVDGVEECLVCGFSPKNPMGMHKLRSQDVILVQRECDLKTSKQKALEVIWNTCCGSFKEYRAILIEDIYGRPYGGINQKKD